MTRKGSSAAARSSKRRRRSSRSRVRSQRISFFAFLENHKTTTSLILIAGAVGLLLHQALILGKVLVPADGIFLFPPWRGLGAASNPLLVDQFLTLQPMRHFIRESLLAGDLPLWNPLIACGVPLLASMQAGVLFPIHLLLTPLPPATAAGWSAFLKLFLAGAFMLMYLRSLGASRAAGVLSGIVFSLSGYMVVWLGHPHVSSAMWLPALFYFVEKGLHKPHRWALCAAVYGFMLLGGHPPTILHATPAACVYFAFRLFTRGQETGAARLKRTGRFLSALAAGSLLAAPQLFPFLEYLGESSSALSSEALARWASSLSPTALLGFFLPNLGGSPALSGFQPAATAIDFGGNFNERALYVGTLPLFLAFAGLRYRDARHVRFHGVLAALALTAVLGLPPWPWIFSRLPGLSSATPTRLILIVDFSLAVLAGLGFDAMLRSRKTILEAKPVAYGFAALAIGAAVIGLRLADKHPPLSPACVFYVKQIGMLAAGVLICLWVTLDREKGVSRTGRLLCLTWVALELLWFGAGINPAVAKERYYPETPGIEALRAADASRPAGRILGLGPALPPNTGMLWGLRDARGMDFMSLRRYEELVRGRAGDFFFFSAARDLPSTLPLLAVSKVAAPPGTRLPEDRFELVYDREITVHERRAPQPRAIPVFRTEVLSSEAALERVRSPHFDPRKVLILEEKPPSLPKAGTRAAAARAAVVDEGPDHVVVEASMPEPGYVLLLDTWHPGWRVRVNAVEAKLLRADYAFRAVAVPVGDSLIRFEFRPGSFRYGVFAAAAALAAILSMLGLGLSREKGRR